MLDGRRAGHNRWQESRTYEKYHSIRWAEISTWQDIWEIPWHQIVGDEHLTFYASYQKKTDSSQVLWKLEIDGKSQNRPFLHFNAYNLLNNCHFNCGNRPLLLIGNTCIIYFNFAFVIHFLGRTHQNLIIVRPNCSATHLLYWRCQVGVDPGGTSWIMLT